MILLNDTDLLPISFLIQSAFGKFMPIAVVGAASPLSTTAVIAFANVIIFRNRSYR